jgi:hypothetical protein
VFSFVVYWFVDFEINVYISLSLGETEQVPDRLAKSVLSAKKLQDKDDN